VYANFICVSVYCRRYAKVSKRVNIQRLKTDIWGNIRSALPAADQDHDGHDTENHQPSAVPRPDKLSGVSTGAREALSFQSMISDLAAGDEVRQRDVTLPFYFICLLHLANEHVSLPLCCPS
jgi:condensin complex subunit 2